VSNYKKIYKKLQKFITKIYKKLQKNFGTVLAQKVVRNAEKLALKDVWCSQNRRLKLLPVNFRYNRTSGEKKIWF
jgi:hypothetical protein